MIHRLLQIVVLFAIVVVAVLLCLDIVYLLNGSLELLPTEEQEDKVRRVTAVLAVLLIAVEVGLWFVYRRLTRKRQAAIVPDD